MWKQGLLYRKVRDVTTNPCMDKSTAHDRDWKGLLILIRWHCVYFVRYFFLFSMSPILAIWKLQQIF